MGLFSSIKDTNQSHLEWNELTDLKQLDQIAQASFEQPIAIFKHSTRCGISRMALKNFESGWDATGSNVKLYLLDLLNHRDVSAGIEDTFGVRHESPQLILLSGGNVILHESHGDISAADVQSAVSGR